MGLGATAAVAALVIANARRHRDEQRARADLETLIDTSPVGVLVFDAKTGGVTSVNREARRIVSGLHMPDGSAEELLDMLTFRRADGREISLEEFPLAQALSTGETVRAEEIVIEVPGGGSVTTLVNATPIRSEEGEVVSVVVTLQDMTPLEEMERLRAEFLGMVSHELRTPLTSIKGSAATLTEAASDLDPAEMLQFFRIIGEQADYMRDLIGDLLDVARIETGELSVAPAPAEVVTLVDEARSRFQSGGGRNNLRIDLSPELPLVMADGRRIIQVLGNLLSNAARHSHEASAIGVSAVREGYHVAVSVTDEGRGIAAERLPHLFRKFSRLEGEDRGRDIAGSGLGLAICKGIVEAHGGRIWTESDGPGLGARFTFTVPVAQDAGIGAANLAVRSRRSERERERILVVDDDPQTLRHVRDALSWATTPTTPPTSSTSLASATAWRRVMRRDLRRGRDLQGLHWQCRVCRTLALWGAPSETAVTVLSSRGRSSNNRVCNALAPARDGLNKSVDCSSPHRKLSRADGLFRVSLVECGVAAHDRYGRASNPGGPEARGPSRGLPTCSLY